MSVEFACRECGIPVVWSGRGRHPYWCEAHKPNRRIRYERKPSALRCGEPDCDKPLHGRGLCKAHHNRAMRAEGYRCESDAWGDRRQSNYHSRRTVVRNGDVVVLSQVLERDGLDCAACGLQVDLSLAWPDRMSKSLDHVLPVSRGGTHTLDNVQLMHLSCNSAKGARIEHGRVA